MAKILWCQMVATFLGRKSGVKAPARRAGTVRSAENASAPPLTSGPAESRDAPVAKKFIEPAVAMK
jgi:hypothetical protein